MNAPLALLPRPEWDRPNPAFDTPTTRKLTMTTLHQMAAATRMMAEYRDVVRGYFPDNNERAIRRAFAALPESEQARALSLPDGRHFYADPVPVSGD